MEVTSNERLICHRYAFNDLSIHWELSTRNNLYDITPLNQFNSYLLFPIKDMSRTGRLLTHQKNNNAFTLTTSSLVFALRQAEVVLVHKYIPDDRVVRSKSHHSGFCGLKRYKFSKSF